MDHAEDAPIDRFTRRRQKSRAALVDAAIELFQSKGVSGTSLEDICDRADVALRTFFNHFETREHLHAELARERALQLAALITELSNDPDPVPERLRRLFEAVGGYLVDRPAYREFISEILHLRPERGGELVWSGSVGRAMRGFVAAGQMRGEISRDHRAEILAGLFTGALTNAMSNWCADGDFDLVEALQESAAVLAELSISRR